MNSDSTPDMASEDLGRAEERSRPGQHPPAAVPGHELERLLGKGGFGEVWLATDTNTRCHVAIKFYKHPGGLDGSPLAREVEKLRFLRGDRYFVQLLAVGWDTRPPYFVMEYVERGSLEDRLAKELPTVSEAVALVREVAVALVHAHAKGILHCDLKPANILLDEDSRPRLADFGQARLLHEHTPAPGTLYYMAPEQADLKAVPDARWDVYALGVLLYRLLTGQLPYRQEASDSQAPDAEPVARRLHRYRERIAASPCPTAHRKVPGVDRTLADIVERCLAVRPDRRYPTAQAVLDALDRRALQRARRPLLILGAIGPVLLAAALGFFAYRGFETTVKESEAALTRQALLSNRFAARFVAGTAAQQMQQRWAILEDEAQTPRGRDLLRRATGKPADQPERRALQHWLDTRRSLYLKTTPECSWFLADVNGILLAASPLELFRHTIDRSVAYRSFFHGGDHDYTPEEMKTHPVKPITQPARSIIFESSATYRPRMVGFSVPMGERVSPLGVLAMGVVLGDFTELQPGVKPGQETNPKGRLAVLVETHKDAEGQEGLLVQHPWLYQFDERLHQAPRIRLPQDMVERLKELRRIALGHGDPGDAALFPDHHDPVREASQGYEDVWSPDYDGPWFAAAEPVIIPPRRDGDQTLDTGWVVLVQERASEVLRPISQLRRELLGQGVQTAGMMLVIVLGLWGSVLLINRDSRHSRLSAFLRRRAGLLSGNTSPPAAAPTPVTEVPPTVEPHSP
jgi:hypothetical protein